MKSEYLKPDMDVVVGYGEPECPVCCVATIIRPAESQGPGVWWLDVYHSLKSPTRQMFHEREIVGLASVAMTESYRFYQPVHPEPT
jgi:hypothetical protein